MEGKKTDKNEYMYCSMREFKERFWDQFLLGHSINFNMIRNKS